MAKKRSKSEADSERVEGMTLEPAELEDKATGVIKTLWDSGVIISHREEMLHTDGLHRFELAPTMSDAALAKAMRQVLPDLLLLLQGAIPKDAKVNS